MHWRRQAPNGDAEMRMSEFESQQSGDCAPVGGTEPDTDRVRSAASDAARFAERDTAPSAGAAAASSAGGAAAPSSTIDTASSGASTVLDDAAQQVPDSPIQGALAELDALAALPVAEHPAVYQRVHAELQSALSDIDDA